MVDRLAEEIQFPGLLIARDFQEIRPGELRAADNDHGRNRSDRYQSDEGRTLGVFSDLFEDHPHPVPPRRAHRRPGAGP